MKVRVYTVAKANNQTQDYDEFESVGGTEIEHDLFKVYVVSDPDDISSELVSITSYPIREVLKIEERDLKPLPGE